MRGSVDLFDIAETIDAVIKRESRTIADLAIVELMKLSYPRGNGKSQMSTEEALKRWSEMSEQFKRFADQQPTTLSKCEYKGEENE